MRKWLFGILAVLVLAGLVSWGFWERANKERLANALEADYQREFYNVISHVEQTRVLLGKSLVSGSPRHNILYLTEIWNRAADAQVSLAQLPFTDINLSASRKFLAQLGDYAFSLARAGANGKQLTDQDYNRLTKLYDEVGRFSADLHQMESRFDRNGFKWTRGLTRDWLRPASAEPQAPSDLSNFVEIEKRIQGLPALIYDGPFSDHLEKIEPKGLTGKEVTSSQATGLARSFLNKGKKQGYNVVHSGTVRGKIAAYTFTFDPADAPGLITVDLSKKGGHPITMINSRTVNKATLSAAEAEAKAARFLEANGYPDMLATYTIRQGNTQVISYAYRQQGVVVYPDLVKVKVALDNGEVVGFEAFNYLMSHRKRDIPKAKLTEAEVKKKINPRVKIENIRKTIIPLDNGKEAFTYEVKGKLGNELYLIYINALTGDEEQILKVINQPEGNLAI